MKKWKIILKLVVFFAIFIGGQALVKYALLDDTLTISRVMMHELYQEEENIDILFCGASHAQLGFDTAVTDEKFQMNTFNAGSSSQGLETSLALIKETAAHHDLKQVYVDLDYSIVMRDMPNPESIYIISDYMKPSFRKVSYLLNATGFDFYFNSFMPLHTNRGYLSNPKQIWENLQKKCSDGYRNYTILDPSYAGKGHIASRTVVEEGSLFSKDGYRNLAFDIPETQQDYLKEIIAFCQSQNIALTFVSLPVTDFHLALVQNYDEYVNAIQEFLKPYQVPYYDFNLMNPDVLQLNSDSFFNDDNHLNTDGAKRFCAVFGDFFTGRLEKEALFLKSYHEKLAAEPPRVLGLLVKKESSAESAKPEIIVTPVVNNQAVKVICEVQNTGDEYVITATVDGIFTNKVNIKNEDLK